MRVIRALLFLLVFLVLVAAPHISSLEKWQEDGHPSSPLYRFYWEATFSDWLFYHRDSWLMILPGLALMLIIATGARGKS